MSSNTNDDKKIIEKLANFGAKLISTAGNSFIFEFGWTPGSTPQSSPELIINKDQLELLQKLGSGKIIGIEFRKGDFETDSRIRIIVS
jgi:hypothetical protein